MREQDPMESQLDQLFREYRAACADPEPGALFMPGIWQKIEARRSVFSWFNRMARILVPVSALAAILMGFLGENSSTPRNFGSSDSFIAEMAFHQTDHDGEAALVYAVSEGDIAAR